MMDSSNGFYKSCYGFDLNEINLLLTSEIENYYTSNLMFLSWQQKILLFFSNERSDMYVKYNE